MKRLSIIFLVVWALIAAVAAQSPAVSLLTCSPGSEVYEIYGHTAIRVVDARGIDVVYNFGMFSFDEPGFVYRFVKGETDHFVACYQTDKEPYLNHHTLQFQHHYIKMGKFRLPS